MSETRRCSICHDLTDRLQHPELHVGTWICCEECWHKMQDYLTARGFSLIQGEALSKEMAFCGKHPKIFNETPAQAWHRAHVDPKDGDSGGHCIRCDLEKAGDYLQGFHNGLTTAPAADTGLLRTELASQAAKIEAVRGLLQEGVDLVWSSVAHVSHGGPTKKEAEGWVNRARVVLGEPKGETL